MQKKYKLAQGVLDYLPLECYAKTEIENRLMNSFRSFGYKQIESPLLERYVLFESGVGKVAMDKLFKVSDIDGDLLVLRPDMTTPTARIVATKLENCPHKLCYLGKAFCQSEKSMLREFTQVGVEYMGEPSVNADIEAVAIAIDGLKSSGLNDFQIELGHIGFFKGFLAALKLSAEETDEIIDLVEKKDSIGEELWAKNIGLSSDNLELITKLPMMFGGVEVLEQARAMCVNDDMKNAINNLTEIFDGLCKIGLGEYISFDLSIVGKMKYYSGLVVKGITKHCGRAILSGGRYDNLCDSFGKHISAVGFAIGIGYLLSAIESGGGIAIVDSPKVAIAVEGAKLARLSRIAEQLDKQGVQIVKTFAATNAELLKEKQIFNFEKALFFAENDTKGVEV